MLEDDYSKQLDRLLESCECDVAVPSEWEERLNRRGVKPSIEGDRRRYVRHHFTSSAVLEYGQTLSAIPREHTHTRVLTCDLSRAGVAFLHADQLFPGERVHLWLSAGKRAYEVVRCVQHDENCFEVGAILVAADT